MFTVTLPLIKKQSEAGTVNTLGELSPADAALANPLPRLMIVDDNRDAGQMLKSLLGTTGYQVLVHEDAESALADAALTDMKVFILDIGLPGMDGYELARRLRASPATQQAVLIAMTGYGQASHREMGKAAGFDHYFVKPIDMPQLTEILEKLNA